MLADYLKLNDEEKPVNKQLRKDADETLKFFLRRLISLALAPSEQITKSCLTCGYFNEQAEVCKKYGNQRPPARVIAFACEGYDDINNDIPF